MSCRRKKNEKITVFVSHFRRLASDNFINVDETPTPPAGTVLEINFSRKANLLKSTLTKANSGLIMISEEQSERYMKILNFFCS